MYSLGELLRKMDLYDFELSSAGYELDPAVAPKSEVGYVAQFVDFKRMLGTLLPQIEVREDSPANQAILKRGYELQSLLTEYLSDLSPQFIRLSELGDSMLALYRPTYEGHTMRQNPSVIVTRVLKNELTVEEAFERCRDSLEAMDEYWPNADAAEALIKLEVIELLAELEV